MQNKQNNDRAQGAIEYLLIIGAAILIVAIVILALVTLSGAAVERTDEPTTSGIRDPIKEKLAEQQNKYYVPQGVTQTYTYIGSGTTLENLANQGDNVLVCIEDNCNNNTSVNEGDTVTVQSGSGGGTIPKTDLEPSTPTPPITFSCGDDFTDYRDGQTYKTVLIGEQCWMAENINVGTRVDIENTGSSQTDSCLEIQKWCYINDNQNCSGYGGLYTPHQMLCGDTDQGICPDGWHIPTLSEFDILKNIVNNDSTKLKAESWNGTDNYGFELLPGGYAYDGSSTALGSSSLGWLKSNYWVIGNNSTINTSTFGYAHWGFSVRCIKN
jgi:uncharacterized protein (TIGR02145 family)